MRVLVVAPYTEGYILGGAFPPSGSRGLALMSIASDGSTVYRDAIEMDVEGDVFGKIYEYFLGKFAMSEGQGGGEFYTPSSIVRLLTEVIEPYLTDRYTSMFSKQGL